MTYVLYVEDSAADAELALATLDPDRPGAPEVVRARDGAEALQRMLGRDPAAGSPAVVDPPLLVVLDLKLPRLGGFEVLREMRSHRDLAEVPVVVVTGSREECDLVEGWRLGANAFLEKPVDLARLIDRMRAEGLFSAAA